MIINIGKEQSTAAVGSTKLPTATLLFFSVSGTSSIAKVLYFKAEYLSQIGNLFQTIFTIKVGLTYESAWSPLLLPLVEQK